jgi:muramoyltetrapeptide carboxypeptidase
MKLQEGDQVFLVAPGSYIKDSSVINEAEKLLRNWNLKIKKGKYIYHKNGHFAGSDKERLEDLQEALNDQQTKLIWAIRGGYGTNRILDQLDFSLFKKNPKILAGFSDITLLHNKIQNLGYPSWHTFMPVNLTENIDPKVINQTYNSFFGKKVSYSFPISSYNTPFNNEIEGIVTGGNLAILYSTLGTPWEVETNDKILMIEDVGEPLYQIDRMMISLKKAEKLAPLKALLVGGFTSIPENDPPFGRNYQEIILEHASEYDFPIIFNFPVGHIKNNYPVILGKKAIVKPGTEKISFIQS